MAVGLDAKVVPEQAGKVYEPLVQLCRRWLHLRGAFLSGRLCLLHPLHPGSGSDGAHVCCMRLLPLLLLLLFL